MNNENIAEVKFFITFNVKDFSEHRSEIFHVHGNPWMFRLKKTHFHQNNEDWLSFYLHSAIENDTSDWAINASCAVKLESTKFGQKPVRGYIGSAAYHQNHLKWGKSGFISWQQLIDSKKGYVKNNECKLEIIVKSSQRQDLTKDECLKFERVHNCDNCSKGVFRLTVKNIDNLFGVCTPEFAINNFKWRISLGEYDRSKISGRRQNKSLRLKLHNVAPAEEQEWSCQTTIKCKLATANPNAESVVLNDSGREFNESTHIHGLTLLKWGDLTDPGKKYLKNGSFALEVKIKVTDVKGEQTKPKLERLPSNNNNNNHLEFACAICFENLADRSVSSFSCGHMFCSECCTAFLAKATSKVCPTCHQELQAFKSRKMCHRVYLPLSSV